MNESYNLSTFIKDDQQGQNDYDAYDLSDLLYLQAMKAKEEYPAQVTLHVSDFDPESLSR